MPPKKTYYSGYVREIQGPPRAQQSTSRSVVSRGQAPRGNQSGMVVCTRTTKVEVTTQETFIQYR
uniref:Uncharacterized protein n=1 Tax=Tetranychus urticae TaxID=32264 RepID=T1L163_TETUR